MSWIQDASISGNDLFEWKRQYNGSNKKLFTNNDFIMMIEASSFLKEKFIKKGRTLEDVYRGKSRVEKQRQRDSKKGDGEKGKG